MSDFRSLLVESRRAFTMRWFKPIPLKNGSLSIQASSDHYSDPRETLDDPKAYTHFEIALCNERGNLTGPPRKLANGKKFPPGLRRVWESGRKPVGPYVKAETIQRIIDLLS